jgi:hypothetical protein
MILGQRSRLVACLVFAVVTGWIACDATCANLGESEAELRLRYGEPKEVLRGGQDGIIAGTDKTLIFLVREPSQIMEVQVGLIGDESVVEGYFLIDNQAEPRPMSREVAERYVRANSQGHEWSPVPVHLFPDHDKDGKDDYLFFWSRSDDKWTTASVQRDPGHALNIQSAKYKVLREAARRR